MVSVHLSRAPPPEAILRAAHELHTNGWTVLEGVISPDECESYIDRIWDWLESLGTGLFNTPSSIKSHLLTLLLLHC